jgi:hypothetical protein
MSDGPDFSGAAGRQLDGWEWNEYPKDWRDPATMPNVMGCSDWEGRKMASAPVATFYCLTETSTHGQVD